MANKTKYRVRVVLEDGTEHVNITYSSEGLALHAKGVLDMIYNGRVMVQVTMEDDSNA